MSAVSGGGDTITVTGTRPGPSMGWYTIESINMLGMYEQPVQEIPVQKISDTGDISISIPLPSWDDIMRVVLGEAHWRENHPGYNFNADDIADQMPGEPTVYRMDDGSYWGDSNGNGKPDTQFWVTEAGVFYDSNMDGQPDRLVGSGGLL